VRDGRHTPAPFTSDADDRAAAAAATAAQLAREPLTVAGRATFVDTGGTVTGSAVETAEFAQ